MSEDKRANVILGGMPIKVPQFFVFAVAMVSGTLSFFWVWEYLYVYIEQDADRFNTGLVVLVLIFLMYCVQRVFVFVKSYNERQEKFRGIREAEVATLSKQSDMLKDLITTTSEERKEHTLEHKNIVIALEALLSEFLFLRESVAKKVPSVKRELKKQKAGVTL